MATQFEDAVCYTLARFVKSIVLKSEQKECIEVVYMGEGCLFVFANRL